MKTNLRTTLDMALLVERVRRHEIDVFCKLVNSENDLHEDLQVMLSEFAYRAQAQVEQLQPIIETLIEHIDLLGEDREREDKKRKEAQSELEKARSKA